MVNLLKLLECPKLICFYKYFGLWNHFWNGFYYSHNRNMGRKQWNQIILLVLSPLTFPLFLTGSRHNVAQAGLRLGIKAQASLELELRVVLLPQHPKFGDYRYMVPWLVICSFLKLLLWYAFKLTGKLQACFLLGVPWRPFALMPALDYTCTVELRTRFICTAN